MSRKPKKPTARERIRDDGIFQGVKRAWEPADDSPEAAFEAIRAAVMDGRRARLGAAEAFARELYEKSGGQAVADAEERLAQAVEAARRRVPGKGGIRLRDYSPKDRKAIEEAQRARDDAEGRANSDAANEASQALQCLENLKAGTGNAAEFAFEAGWHLARSQALFRAEAARHGKAMDSKLAAKRPRKKSADRKAPLKEAARTAYKRFRADWPKAPFDGGGGFLEWIAANRSKMAREGVGVDLHAERLSFEGQSLALDTIRKLKTSEKWDFDDKKANH